MIASRTNGARSRSRALTVLVALATLTSASLIVAPAAYAAHDSVPCDDGIPSGYDCTELLNKGTGDVIGELFFKRTDSTLLLRTNLFTVADTGHTGVKL